ncbi:MAG: von Willebrand factor type A domain-containing protein [Verrucomicrobiota bacterium]|nr:von Willebrand factor type A domain-containing protein [Verrucomicrobiota bacterium]
MNKCLKIKKKLTNYLFGETSQKEHREISRHLEKCDKCADLFGQIVSAMNELMDNAGMQFGDTLSDSQRAEIYAIATKISSGEFEEVEKKKLFADSAKKVFNVVQRYKGIILQIAAVLAIVFTIAGLFLPALNQAKGVLRRNSPNVCSKMPEEITMDEIEVKEISPQIIEEIEQLEEQSSESFGVRGSASLLVSGKDFEKRSFVRTKRSLAKRKQRIKSELLKEKKSLVRHNSTRDKVIEAVQSDVIDPDEDWNMQLKGGERVLESETCFSMELPMKSVAKEPVSTFSIDVDTASYTNARSKILSGRKPRRNSIRQEEFVNYFDYRYPAPELQTFRILAECARSPFKKNRHILRIAVQGKRPGSDTKRPSAFTFVIDTSGSMASYERLPLLKKTFEKILQNFHDKDRISILTCGVTTKLIINRIPATDKKRILKALDNVKAYGRTDIEKGLVYAYKFAEKNYVGGAYNRVILFSDGVTNLGENVPDKILKKVKSGRDKGIAFTAIGMGRSVYNDHFLETLADSGDGNYFFIDSEEEAERIFIKNFSGAFHLIAKDVKIQVVFDNGMVKKYRQIGYDNRQLKKEDFRNDKVDAGEVGAGQSVTALYEMYMNNGEIKKDFSGNIAEIRVRWKDAHTAEVHEINRFCGKDIISRSFAESTDSFKLAVIVAEFAEFLKYGRGIRRVSINDILRNLQPLQQKFKHDSEIKTLETLMLSIR